METQEYQPEEQKKKRDYTIPISIIVAALLVAGSWVYTKDNASQKNTDDTATAGLMGKTIAPATGVALPVKWNDLGKQMVDTGVIDAPKLEQILISRGEFSDDVKNLLNSANNKEIKISPENSGALLNLFWALGLSNKNEILENGPMSDPQFGGADKFASTGGWTLAQGNVMNHYSMHSFINIAPEQQNMVKEIAQNIYRPCCNNPTHFPDCNHGMAMLGLIELMASQNSSKEEIYKTALQVNTYWFPEQYRTIATYLKSKNIDIAAVNPQKILGEFFSSGSGYQQILANATDPAENKSSGGSCGV